MNSIAIYVGTTYVYWNSIVIVLGILSCLALSIALYSANNGRGAAMWVMFPLAVFFSVTLSRAIHWYCHGEQYESFISCLMDYSSGSFCLPGVLFGTWFAAYLVRCAGYTDKTARLLDCTAPGMALLIALIRLSALFTNTCRSKLIVTSPALCRLPFAVGTVLPTGETEYVFATFFVMFIVMMALFVGLMRFYVRRNNLPMRHGFESTGHTARMFLLFYSAAELLLDSTRNDSSYIHLRLLTSLNKYTGFISLVQLVSAISILCILLYYSKRSVKIHGVQRRHWAMWIVYFFSLVGVGVSEYCVQRFSGKYILCYSIMLVCCIVMAVDVYRMYLTVCRGRKRAESLSVSEKKA